jgi:hypothetical protein
MTTIPTDDRARTGLLFVDPYNDFLSDGGKLGLQIVTVGFFTREEEMRHA